MPRSLEFDEAGRMLRSRADLMSLGWSDRRIRAGVGADEVVRVRRGWFVTTAAWADLWAEGRHLVQVVAAARDMAGGSHVFSYYSAAVLWGLPLYRFIPETVHLTGATRRQASSTPGVTRHEDLLRDEEVVVVDGVRCTSLERTVFDLSRIATAEVALAAADAALRSRALQGRVYDEARAEQSTEILRALSTGRGALRGVRQARRIAGIADGRAQLPGESVSRLQLLRLGFARPRLQAPVPGPDGSTYWIDIAMDDVNAFGEFDGKAKYLDEALRQKLPLEEVLLREKQREDWVRGTTQRRFARWGDEHITSPALLGARLASFGIHPPS